NNPRKVEDSNPVKWSAHHSIVAHFAPTHRFGALVFGPGRM
ncbi:MAG: hypothetical protein ACI8Y4_003395, partial [Candidatus Poriferisodalaceae bacterium]